MTYIAYDRLTLKILAFISGTVQEEQLAEVFQNFENYDVAATEMIPPDNYQNHEVILEDGVFVGFKKVVSAVG